MEIRPWRSSTTRWSRGARSDLVVALLLGGHPAAGRKRVSGGHGADDGRLVLVVQAKRNETWVVVTWGVDGGVQSERMGFGGRQANERRRGAVRFGSQTASLCKSAPSTLRSAGRSDRGATERARENNAEDSVVFGDLAAACPTSALEARMALCCCNAGACRNPQRRRSCIAANASCGGASVRVAVRGCGGRRSEETRQKSWGKCVQQQAHVKLPQGCSGGAVQADSRKGRRKIRNTRLKMVKRTFASRTSWPGGGGRRRH